MNSSPFRPVARVALLVFGLVSLLNNPAAAAPRVVTAPVEGLRDASPRVHALVGARIVTAPGQVVEKGTLVIRDGVIEAVGADVTPPADARVWDVTGRTLFAGFIESQSNLFLPAAWKPVPPPKPDAEGAPAVTPRPAPVVAVEPAAGPHAWNARVTPERDVADQLLPDAKGAEALRKLGFAVAHLMPARGVFRGQTALVSLGDGDFTARVVRGDVAQVVAFEHAGFYDRGYPSSLMGSIALIRQTLLDGQWYADTQAAFAKHPAGLERPETNGSLAALGPVVRGEQPVIIELGDELDALRALKLAQEFKLKVVLRGSGYDYRVVRSLTAATPVILPLDFPEAPGVESPAQALDISLDRLEHWELAPGNAGRLAAAGVPVALTTAGLKKPETEFWSRLRQAVRSGLDENAALAALTTTPAEIFGVASTHGTLAPGRAADVVVASGDLFKSDDAEIELVWVDGKPFELPPWRRADARGKWRATWQGAAGPAEFQLAGRTAAKLKATAGGKDATVHGEDDTLLLLAPGAWFGLAPGVVRLTARAAGSTLDGSGELPDGTSFRWSAERTGPADPAKADAAEKEKPPAALVAKADIYPAGAFGRAGLPAQPEWVLVQHAMVWTSAAAGNLENTDVLAHRGKIERLGRGLAAPAGAVVIDATGKALTAGLIDCHSHTAISGGVNEGGHSVTCEVRIGDVLDATDIDIYRELAGGLTVANVLHGSANAIGGQCQVIKLRWGGLPEDLKFAGAKPDVKFALGENVTRKNSPTSTRYPVSRMGVREIMTDTFTRARDYEHLWAEYRAGRSPLPPRRDLQLDAALEILRGERAIHIHSYRQDEILMFIRLAQEWKLPVAAFQHILEGYKVAPEIASIGAGGSTFSDWWAYKYEVIDAIPYNGALMRSAGVVMSFNSDDAELACRLNTEAAKAMKYGGVPPEEALKFVTINPAKQLSIDNRVGSIEVGKDADFVIWSGSPLSSLSRAEQTWIDGRRYFSLADDALLRTAAATERAALLQKILPERQKALAGGGARGGDSPPAGDSAPPGRGLYDDGRHAENCSTEGGSR